MEHKQQKFHCSECCPNKPKRHHKWLERMVEVVLVTVTSALVVIILRFLGI